MPRKFSRCLKIAHQIGDRRVDRILRAIFEREMKAYRDDEKNYKEMLEELEARVEHRHGLILELMKIDGVPVVDECLVILRAAEQEDYAEMGRLIQMGHAAALHAGEKSRMLKKLKKVQ